VSKGYCNPRRRAEFGIGEGTVRVHASNLLAESYIAPDGASGLGSDPPRYHRSGNNTYISFFAALSP